jgi:hypothetical protein
MAKRGDCPQFRRQTDLMSEARQKTLISGTPPEARPRIPFAVWMLVVLLLALFAVQNLVEMTRESCSSDEVAHLPAGYTYLLKHDFRLNREHPPLMKVLCALPLLALHPKIDFNNPEWAEASPRSSAQFGFNFLYSNDADRLLFWGRLPVVLIAVLLGFFVFRWAQQLYGYPAGLFALGLFAFSPNIIAHSHLVTTDLGFSAFSTISFYFLWRYLSDGKPRAFLGSAAAMGAALASKFSAIFLFPLALLLLWMFYGAVRNKLHREAPSGSDGSKPAAEGGDSRHFLNAAAWPRLIQMERKKVMAVLAFVGIAAIVVQLSYLGSPDVTLYLKGMLQVDKNFDPQYPAYLHGGFSTGGWWYYYVVAFLVKATAPFLILILVRLIQLVRDRATDLWPSLFLILPGIVLFTAVSVFAAPIGIRYVLPVFPLLMVYVSGVVKTFNTSKAALAIFGVLLCWHIASSLAAFPYSLSYFNELAGGPSRGIYWLDDSNLDWGQDLKGVKQVMSKMGIESVTLVPFNSYDNPEYYGIRMRRPSNQEWTRMVTSPNPLPPGIYVVSGHWVAIMHGLGIDWVKKHPVIAHLGYSIYFFRIS